jgi:hypothetical protein
MTRSAPTVAERREQALEHLRATVPANASRGAEASTGAVGRLGMTELLRAAVLVAELDGLAADDEPSGAG